MTTNEYPKMLLKYPSTTNTFVEAAEGKFDYIAVEDAEEEKTMAKEGWCLTTIAAKAKNVAWEAKAKK